MKKFFVKSISALFLMTLGFGLSAQNNNNVLDGMFIKETAPTKRVIPYTHIREADVMYYKRLVRVIDLRQKLNFPLYYPVQPINEIGYVRKSLIDIIRDAITSGELTAYENDDFQVALTKSEAEGKLSAEVQVPVEDPVTFEITMETKIDPVTADKIIRYEIKEDWVFDRERSVMEVRIIGIQPIYMKIDENGIELGPSATFWIYYPEARFVLANHEVYNPNNDATRLTFEDYLRKRIFSSYIKSETNVYDNRLLNDYTSGVDMLLESRRIEEEIMYTEHDMWQY